MTDCLIIGMNSLQFEDYLGMVKSMGTDGGAYRDLNLSFIEYEGKPYQALDLLSLFYARHGGERAIPFHNADFVWPTIVVLGSYLHRHGHSFDYVNSFLYEKELLAEKLLRDEILTVAITTTLYVVPWPILEIISFIRKHNQKVKIVVGGPYIANVAKNDRSTVEMQLESMGADYYVISSEGERTLDRLITALKSGDDLREVENLAFKQGERWVFTRAEVERNDLAENRPDYTLFGQPQLGAFVSTRTAKSCPFACAFCNFPQQAGKYVYTDAELVEKELDALRDLGGVEMVTFIDDTFNVPKKRFREILQMMIRNKYDFKWNCNFRSDHADDEIISMMAEAGCEGVFLGVESGSDTMLGHMNKTARRKDYLWAIPRLKEEGILAHANLFIGFPGETLETVAETVDLIRQTRPETYSVQPWYANPLTPVWKKKELFQIVGSSFHWSHETMDAATACDLVDRVFLSVDDSIFLPQYGFFQWSIFYLRKLGMSLERQKRYLRCFNALVRDKMTGSPDPQVRAQLLASLEAASYFDDQDPAPVDMGPVELYAGARREAAQRYCERVFLDSDDGRALSRSLGTATAAWHTETFTLDGEAVAALQAAHEGDLFELGLAAFGVLLWRLSELGAATLAVTREDASARQSVPLLVRPAGEQSFAQLAGAIRAEVAEALEHRLFSFHLLTSDSKVSPFCERKPVFAASYSYSEGSDAVMEPPGQVPEAHLRIMATLCRKGDAVQVLLSGRSEAPIVAAMSKHLRRIFDEVCKAPAAPVAGLGTIEEQETAPDVSEVLRGQDFVF